MSKFKRSFFFRIQLWQFRQIPKRRVVGHQRHFLCSYLEDIWAFLGEKLYLRSFYNHSFKKISKSQNLPYFVIVFSLVDFPYYQELIWEEEDTVWPVALVLSSNQLTCIAHFALYPHKTTKTKRNGIILHILSRTRMKMVKMSKRREYLKIGCTTLEESKLIIKVFKKRFFFTFPPF